MRIDNPHAPRLCTLARLLRIGPAVLALPAQSAPFVSAVSILPGPGSRGLHVTSVFPHLNSHGPLQSKFHQCRNGHFLSLKWKCDSAAWPVSEVLSASGFRLHPFRCRFLRSLSCWSQLPSVFSAAGPTHVALFSAKVWKVAGRARPGVLEQARPVSSGCPLLAFLLPPASGGSCEEAVPAPHSRANGCFFNRPALLPCVHW